LYASFYERDHLRQALVTDTVVLNSGEIVTGQLDDETPTNVQIEVANATRTIYTARLIPKADIKSLQRESTEHKEQRPLVEELLKYKLSPDQEFTAKVYADAIARFNGFLKRYPQSDFAPGLQAIRDAWQYEADQLAKGSVKFAGVWMNPDTKRVLLAAREKQVDAVRQASPQHKLKKPAEIQDLLQATQADWVEACGQLSAAIGAGASQAAKVPKLQQAFDGLLPHIATYQRELGIQVGDESLSGGKNRTIGYSDMETMIQAILAGAAGVGTWPGGELSVMETPTRPVPVQVHNAGPFGPLLNPGRGN
jgi:hypothetical protein